MFQNVFQNIYEQFKITRIFFQEVSNYPTKHLKNYFKISYFPLNFEKSFHIKKKKKKKRFLEYLTAFSPKNHSQMMENKEK